LTNENFTWKARLGDNKGVNEGVTDVLKKGIFEVGCEGLRKEVG